MDKINDYLWISDIVKDDDYDNVPDEIDRVVDVSGYDGENSDLWFPLKDGENEQVRFDAIVQSVIKMIEEGDTVLIHCAAGVSRSVGVGMAVLKELEGINWVEAREMIRDIRKVANPNEDILLHVQNYPGGDDEKLDLKKMF